MEFKDIKINNMYIIRLGAFCKMATVVDLIADSNDVMCRIEGRVVDNSLRDINYNNIICEVSEYLKQTHYNTLRSFVLNVYPEHAY